LGNHFPKMVSRSPCFITSSGNSPHPLHWCYGILHSGLSGHRGIRKEATRAGRTTGFGAQLLTTMGRVFVAETCATNTYSIAPKQRIHKSSIGGLLHSSYIWFLRGFNLALIVLDVSVGSHLEGSLLYILQRYITGKYWGSMWCFHISNPL